MSKIDKLREERKDVIKDYSSKLPSNNYIKNIYSKDDNLNVLVSEIIEETKDTKSFILTPNKSLNTNELVPFKAGMYISVLLNIDGNYVSRAYSISSNPSYALKGNYRITIKRVDNGLVSNYMLDKTKVGDELIISRPTGEFYYNKNRDEKNVIAIAGGSGITPFISMAYETENNLSDYNLTVFYSVKKESDIIFKEEIANFNKKSKKVKFIINLTEEEKEGYNYGRINKDMLEPYIKEFNSIFMCGPKGLYKTMNDILSSYNIPKKCVHYENFASSYEPSTNKKYKLKLIMKGETKEIPCESGETLLVSMEKAGIKAPSLCRVGTCGFCRSILIEGKIKMVGASNLKDLGENDYIHPCVTYPESDIVIRIDI